MRSLEMHIWGQKRLGPRQFGGSKIAFAEIQGVATQVANCVSLDFLGESFAGGLELGAW